MEKYVHHLKTTGDGNTVFSANVRSEADLLRKAIEAGVGLTNLDLEHYTLNGMDLNGKTFKNCNLTWAELSGCDLDCAVFDSCTMTYIDCRGASLVYAKFKECTLTRATFDGAVMRCVEFEDSIGEYITAKGADLQGADPEGILSAHLITDRVSNEGRIIGYKKCLSKKGKHVIVKLAIPAKAQRMNAPGERKCRAEYADVLEIIGGKTAFSSFDSTFEYRVGERVFPTLDYDETPTTCSTGIHYFVTREEAEAYYV